MALREILRRATKGRRAARRARRPGLEGLESRQLLAVSIAEFPTQLVGAHPTSITAVADGNLWFTLPQDNEIGSINPTTHALQFFSGGGGQSITAGSDGNLWFTSGTSIGTFNLTTHTFAQFSIPSGGQAVSITSGSDGNLWFTEFQADKPYPTDTLGQINPTTHAIAEFSAPVAVLPYVDVTSNITSGPDGNLWMTSSQTHAIVSFNPVTHASAVFLVPVHTTSEFIESPDGLSGITTGPDGDLWFTETMANRVGRINPTTHAIDEFFLPSPSSYPTGITAGPDGEVWFTEAARQNQIFDGPPLFIPLGVSAVASINPTTGAISTVPTPSINTNPLGIAVGPDGNLWFAEEQADQIGEAFFHPDDGPQFLSVARLGVHNQPTSLVLAFNQPLDATSAENVGNYALVGPNRRPVRIAAALYDAAAGTVTLLPASRLNVHWNYTLTVVGTAPHGVRNTFGDLLDGAGTGQPGSNFQAAINWRNLIIDSRAAARATRAAALAARARHH